MSTTAKSLSIVVPVHNAERNLAQRVGRLLEVLPDLATKFEVLIVDDGSTDQTEDVALELSHQYPQVRVTRHPKRRGIEASAQTGAAHTSGDIVIVHAGQELVNASQLRRMWQQRADEELVVAPVKSDVGGLDSEVLGRLENCGNGIASERTETLDRGGNATSQLPRGQKAAHIPAPTFRFSSSDSRSSMHR